MRNPLKPMVDKFGLPRVIIVSFFLLLVVAASAFRMNLLQLLSDVIRRWGMFGILALAMVPAVQCGIGLNFGISMGIVGGLLGGLLAIQLRIAEMPSLVAVHPLFAMWVAILFAVAVGVVLAMGIGYLYGQLLNKVKGSEMTVTTYVGFSIIAFMNILWMLLPFDNGELIWSNAGKGLRNTISLATSFSEQDPGFQHGGPDHSHRPSAVFLPDVSAGMAVYAVQNRDCHECGRSQSHVCQGGRH